MRDGIRSLWKDERGVSVVIGTMLMLLIVAAMWGTVQAYHVPRWNRAVENEHLNMVYGDMITFKSDVEDVALSGEPKSSVFRMGVRYPNRMFLVNPGTGVAGSLTSDGVPVSIAYDAGLGVVTQAYTSNRVIYDARGTVDSPKMVYEHGVIIRDYGDEYASADQQSLIVGDEIHMPVLIGNLAAASSMETESITLKPLSQSSTITNVTSVTITLDTDYPEVWEQLLAGTSTANTTVSVNQTPGEIVISSTAIRQIRFPDTTTNALYVGMIDLSTTSAPHPVAESVFITGGGTGIGTNMHRTAVRYIPMSSTGLSATESAVQQTVPMAGTLSQFYVTLNGSPGSGRGYTFVVRKNGVNTLVTCTISGTATTGSDVTNSVSFAAGDKISIRVTPVNNPTARSMCWTAKFSPS